MPISQDRLREAAERGSRLEKLKKRADPEGINASLQAIVGSPWKDEGLLNKADMRKWMRYWEARGKSVQADAVGNGLYHCHLKLKSSPRQAGARLWKSALIHGDIIAYMARHGTTVANKKDHFRGREDFDLDEKGEKDAENIAKWFVDHGVKPKHIITSPMKRAHKTALAIGKALGVEVRVEPRLLPFDVGEFTGKDKEKTWDDFVYYLDHPDEKVPGGESVQDFGERECAALDEILEEAAKYGPVIMVVHTSNIVIADCYLRTGEIGLDCRPEEKDIVAPGGAVAISRTLNIWPVYKDVKEEETEDKPDKAKHEEYDAILEGKDHPDTGVEEKEEIEKGEIKKGSRKTALMSVASVEQMLRDGWYLFTNSVDTEWTEKAWLVSPPSYGPSGHPNPERRLNLPLPVFKQLVQQGVIVLGTTRNGIWTWFLPEQKQEGSMMRKPVPIVGPISGF